MNHLLDLGDGQPPIVCRDAKQAMLLARLWVAFFPQDAPHASLPAVQGSGSPQEGFGGRKGPSPADSP